MQNVFSDYFRDIEQSSENNGVLCLLEFVNFLVDLESSNIIAVELYGGFVRDGNLIPHWSDIDLIIIYKDIIHTDLFLIADNIALLINKYEVRLDVTQLSLCDIEDEQLIKSCFWSDVINVLSLRDNVSQTLYGELPSVKFSLEQEKAAALFYINSTLGAFRRLIIESATVRYNNNIFDQPVIFRAIRWLFSIIRASLRLFEIFVHPYEASILILKDCFKEIDVSLLEELCLIRNSSVPDAYEKDLLLQIERYAENYIRIKVTTQVV